MNTAGMGCAEVRAVLGYLFKCLCAGIVCFLLAYAPVLDQEESDRMKAAEQQAAILPLLDQAADQMARIGKK
jgi:hypothetical protein